MLRSSASLFAQRISAPKAIFRSFTIARPEPIKVRLPEDVDIHLVNGSIPKWFKKEGDQIKKGEPLCEVDTGEVVFDFNSPIGGFLVRITALEGATGLKSGEVIAYLAGSRDEITAIGYEAAKDIALHKVNVHDPNADLKASTPTPTTTGDSLNLSDWLKQLGGEEMMEYEVAFKNEGFTSVEALKTLEEADLDAMNISKRGHRKLLLAGVVALK